MIFTQVGYLNHGLHVSELEALNLCYTLNFDYVVVIVVVGMTTQYIGI